MISFTENNTSNININGIKEELFKTELAKYATIYDVSVSKDFVTFWIKTKIGNATLGSIDISKYGEIEFTPVKFFNSVIVLNDDSNKLLNASEILKMLANYKTTFKSLFLYLVK